MSASEQLDKISTTLPSVVVRFAGDSGDGMQVTGNQFSQTNALAGNDVATFPDFPAEIRAPTGTTYGVSAFQIHFGDETVLTPGDQPDVLVAMNPAALKVNLHLLHPGGQVILDIGSFDKRHLAKAGFDVDPREDDTLKPYRVLEIDISKYTLEVAKPFGLSQKEAMRCKNMWTLGLVYWMYGRDMQPTIEWLSSKFAKKPEVADANIAALKAGHAFGETSEIAAEFRSAPISEAHLESGLYRLINGAEAAAWGLVAGTQLANLEMTFCSYPITPSSPLLHILSDMKEFGVTTFQAEDEISAACAALGASYAGTLGVTASSGPGVALKTETLGLAISTELPMVIVNTQRAGPSTGMPTKTEQSDLLLSVWGRNADAPMPVISAHSPSDSFEAAIESVRIATKYMTPVFLLTDGYIANTAEPWLIPDFNQLEPFPVEQRTDPTDFNPALRDPETLARVWAKPGTPGLEHRIGGIEKSYETGHISYDPENHQRMTNVRRAKIDGIARDIPLQKVELGEPGGKLAVIGWGSTYGALYRAVTRLRQAELDVSHIHIRHIWPLPSNLCELIESYEQVLVAEMNTGQLFTLLRSQYPLSHIDTLTKVSGQPFTIREIEASVRDHLANPV